MRPTETDALTMRIIAVLRDVLYIPEQRFCPAMPLADLDLDSLDLVEAGLELEAMFGCPLPTAGLGAARTVGELAACLAGQPPRPALALALVARRRRAAIIPPEAPPPARRWPLSCAIRFSGLTR